MEWIRAGFSTLVFVLTFVGLHFAAPDWYSSIRRHMVYEDLVAPYMESAKTEFGPLLKEALEHPEIKPYMAQYLPDFNIANDSVVIESDVQNTEAAVVESEVVKPLEDISQLPQKISSKKLVSNSSQNRAPASMPVVPQKPATRGPASVEEVGFPFRGPASQGPQVDQGTRLSVESKIKTWVGSGQCAQAQTFYKVFIKEQSLSLGDPWVRKVNQEILQRCP